MAGDAKEKENKKQKRATAQKRQIQDKKKRLANRSFKTEVRHAIRQLREGIKSQDKEKLKATLSNVYSLLDKGVKKAIFKKNKASRLKARLTAYISSKIA